MTTPPPLGRFTWHELMTSDPSAAKGFYPALTGWGTSAWDDGSYTMWMNGEAPAGGLMLLPDEVKAAGAPPHWFCYLGTPDCDQTAARISAAGGAVLKAPWDIPDIGRIAIVADPQGAAFGLYTPLQSDPSVDAPPAPGQFSWHELSTTDPEAAIAFYRDIFGWDAMGGVDMGDMGTYHLLGYAGAQRIGVMRRPPEVPVSHWLPYILVPDADQAFATATAQGAAALMPPMEVPGGDRVAVMTDPQGAVFAVHALKK